MSRKWWKFCWPGLFNALALTGSIFILSRELGILATTEKLFGGGKVFVLMSILQQMVYTFMMMFCIVIGGIIFGVVCTLAIWFLGKVTIWIILGIKAERRVKLAERTVPPATARIKS